ncbi:MAG TPA: CYTH domain-containing protein, partial [Candidatus Bathyarchaeota archaeon]|nr:CYTH domain-containing protein [Candidatus Bathyarchaeota archaeon]
MLRQKNVEVKARLRDLSEAEELLASLGATKLKVLHQTDYYFEVP